MPWAESLTWGPCFSGLRFFRIKQMNSGTATPDYARWDHFSLWSRRSIVVCGVRQQLILQMLSTKQKVDGLKVMKKFSYSESTAASQRLRPSSNKPLIHYGVQTDTYVLCSYPSLGWEALSTLEGTLSQITGPAQGEMHYFGHNHPVSPAT